MTQDEINKQLIQSDIDTSARIAAIEVFVRELAIQALGDTPETGNFLKTIQQQFHKKKAEIENFNKRN